MRILYKKVTLEYFKGVRNLEVEFNDDTTRISGANRTGKTTVADAITWCLFGKDSAGRTQFGIKTRENGVEIPYVIAPRRPGDIAENYADPSKAKALLGWEAEKNLEDMCRDTYRFQKKNPRGYES